MTRQDEEHYNSDDGSDGDTIDQSEEEPAAVVTGLSKSWAQHRAHVPIYTGGRLRFHTTVLLTPSAGDVSISLAESGIQQCTVRGNNDEDDDDEEGYDPDTITAYAISAQTLMTCSAGNVLRQYAMTTNNTPELVKVWGASGHALPVTLMEFHGAYLATASVDGSVRIWDARRAVLTHVFRGTHKVTAVQWRLLSPSQVVVGRQDGSVVVYDLFLQTTNNNVLARLEDHDSAVTAIAWCGDNDAFMVTGARDSVVNVWDVTKNYAKVHTLPVMEQVEGLVAWKGPTTTHQHVIATAGSKGVVRLWSMEITGRLSAMGQQTQKDSFGEARGGYLQLEIREETGQLAVADAEHNIMYLSVRKEDSSVTTDQTIVGNNDEILDLKMFPHSPHCVVATNSHLVRIFDTTHFSCQVLDGHNDTVLCVDLSPCGGLIATCGKDKTMRLWKSDQQQQCIAVAEGHTEAVGAVALSRKQGKYQVGGKAARNGGGAFAVTVSADRTLKRWNLTSELQSDDGGDKSNPTSLHAARSTRAHEKDINIVAVAPNDSLIATGSQDKTARLWKATDLTLVATLKGHRRGVWDCQFSPQDRVIATGSGDKTIKLWSLSGDYACVRTFQGHVASVLRLRFISNGLQLLSSGADGLLKLWTVRTNECEATLDSHTGKVWAMDVSSDGRRALSGGGDARIVEWKDITAETHAAERAEQAEAILIDQELANLLRQKDYKKALTIALEREKPFNALKILEKIVSQDIEEGKDCLKNLQTLIAAWPTDRVVRIMRYAREWNTKARNSHIAMLVIKSIVTSIPVHRLIASEEVPEIAAGILPYTERHFKRLDGLHSSSYLLNFVLNVMGSLGNDDEESGEFKEWESSAHKRYVLPPKQMDGRADVGVQPIDEEHDSDAVVTVGDSSDSE